MQLRPAIARKGRGYWLSHRFASRWSRRRSLAGASQDYNVGEGTLFTPLEQSQYDVVHQFPGGAVKLASLAGMSAGTLSNKVNPGMETHKLSVGEAVVIQNLARDYRILHAEASALSHVCIPLVDLSRVSDTELLNAYARVHMEMGEMAAAINAAFDDKRILRAEFNRIAKESDDAVRAMFELRARLEALIDD